MKSGAKHGGMLVDGKNRGMEGRGGGGVIQRNVFL